MTTDERRVRVSSDVELRQFYAASFDEVYRYASRVAGPDRQRAEDLVQDAFLALVRAIRAERIDEVSVAWLITAVRNRFIDQVRRDRNVVALEPQPLTVDTDAAGDTAPMLTRLQPIERGAVVLHYIDGFSVKEVATMLGKSTRATESILARARSKMRSLLEGERHG